MSKPCCKSWSSHSFFAVAALEEFGAKIERDDNGEVVIVDLDKTQIADAGLVYLRELTKLEQLILGYTQITDAGLVHLKGLTDLQTLFLSGTQVTGISRA